MSEDRAYPLHWPQHWPRTKAGDRKRAQFRTTLHKAMDNVDKELQRFANDSDREISDIVISSNFSLTARNPADPGVACYFTWDETTTCICVDRYDRLEHNLQAIFHCLEAERTKLRHGGINLVRAAFRGYAALPPPRSNTEPWYQVLEVQESCTLIGVRRAYQHLRSKHHPDKGGDPAEFQRIQIAWEQYNAEHAA